jgi:hypothetical protein
MPVVGFDDIPPAPGAGVPDWPMFVPDFALPVAPAPVPAAGVDPCVGAPSCVADGAAGALGVLLPAPVFGALPVPVVWASAGAIIVATIARMARTLMTRGAMVLGLLLELFAPV